MSRKQILFTASAVLIMGTAQGLANIYISPTATCVGASDCKACKNCKYCKRCSQDGLSLGVCK